jgi:hypothetical protein
MAIPTRPETASFIEEGIQPLLVALAWWPEIDPFNLCEHHPYVSFYCKTKEALREIKALIKETGWGVFPQDLSRISPPGTPKERDLVCYRGGPPDLRGALYSLRPYERNCKKASFEQTADRPRHPSYDPELDWKDKYLKALWPIIYEFYPVYPREEGGNILIKRIQRGDWRPGDTRTGSRDERGII